MNIRFSMIITCWGLIFSPALTVCASATNDSLYESARRNAHAGSYAEALSALDALLAIDPTHVDALLLCGSVHLWQKDFAGAEAMLLKTVTLAPGYRDAWAALIDTYYRMGKPQTACSTAVKARSLCAGDSVLAARQQAVCQSSSPEGGAAETDTRPAVEIHAGAGASFFEKTYARDPWQNGEFGIAIEQSRWAVGVNLHAQRRVYGGLPLYGAEIECAPRLMPLPKLAITLRLSCSPYRLFDTLFASEAVNAEINAGLPGGIEIDAAARCRWYGALFSPSYAAGIGKYLGRFLLSTRVFIATAEKKWHASGAGEVRMFSRKRENAFGALGLAFGRSPYDAGTVTSNGYLSFIESTIKTRIGISDHIALMPSIAVAGEQFTKMADFNGDQAIETWRSGVWMKTSLLLMVYFKKGG